MKIDFLGALAGAASDLRKARGDRSRNDPPSNDAGGVGPQQWIGYGAGGRPLQVEWDHDRAISEGFQSCSWVFACIDRLAGACSGVPWTVLERKGEEWEPADGHALEQAIEYPNDEMSRQEMITGIVQHLGCGGNALWRIVYVRRNGEFVPEEFWPLNPTHYKVVPVEDSLTGQLTAPMGLDGKRLKWIMGYSRTDRPSEPMLPPHTVFHARLGDPLRIGMWGMSPMRALAQVIDMDVRQVAWNAALPENAMVPRGAIIDRNLRNDRQITEMANRLAARYASPDHAGTPLVFGAGTDYIRMALTPQEMDWIDSRRFTMAEICAAFGVLPSLFIPDSKYANQESAVKHMKKNGAARMLDVIEDAFNRRLIPRDKRRTMWIHYDNSGDPDLAESLNARLEAHERAVRAAIPPNKSFLLLDLPVEPVDGGDEPMVSGTLVSLKSVHAEPEPVPPGLADEDEVNPAGEEPTPKPNGQEPPMPPKPNGKPAPEPVPS